MTPDTLVAPPPAPPTEASGTITFPRGIPGFTAHRHYVLIDRDDLTPLRTLQAVDQAGPSFLVVDPRLVDGAYDCTPGAAERRLLEAGAGDPLVWFVLVTVTADGAWANLQAPIVINARRMTGCQMIRDDDRYPVQRAIGRG